MAKKRSLPNRKAVLACADGQNLPGMNVLPGRLCLRPHALCGRQRQIGPPDWGIHPDYPEIFLVSAYVIAEIQGTLKPEDLNGGSTRLTLCNQCPGSICPVAEAKLMAIPRANTGKICSLFRPCHFPKADCIFRRPDRTCGRNCGARCEPEAASYEKAYGQSWQTRLTFNPPATVTATPAPAPAPKPATTAVKCLVIGDLKFPEIELPRIWTERSSPASTTYVVHLPHPKSANKPPARIGRRGGQVGGAGRDASEHRWRRRKSRRDSAANKARQRRGCNS